MRLTFLRHAESEYNKKGILQGRIDCDLSINGIKQTHKKAETFNSSQYDLCFCSPLKRTMETARILVPNMETIYDDRLIERSLGDWEGTPVSNEKNFLLNLEDSIPPNGESQEDLFLRVAKFIKYLKKYYNNKKILIITHAGIVYTTQELLKMPKKAINNLDTFVVDISD